MTQPSPVIYLPPGVTLGGGAAGAPVPVNTGIPFDRNFFEHVLPPSIQAFCSQVKCKIPVVELMTLDGTKHYVNGIAGVSDSWVALQTSTPDHPHPAQVFIPYQTIFRVEIHPESDERRGNLGFDTSSKIPAQVVIPAPKPAKAGASKGASKAATKGK